jgi:formate dehydrogenase subunit gamma
MHPPDAAASARFTSAERWVHGLTAVLVGVCIASAAVLYDGTLAVLVGYRYVVEQVHVWCGYAIPAPLLIGLLSGSYRLDLGRLNRFTDRDWAWLRSRSRRDGHIPVGKFNAGQKLNAALSLGSVGVLLATGTVMYFTGSFRLSWRSGATFTHDWFALGFGLLIIGHIMFVSRYAEPRRPKPRPPLPAPPLPAPPLPASHSATEVTPDPASPAI